MDRFPEIGACHWGRDDLREAPCDYHGDNHRFWRPKHSSHVRHKPPFRCHDPGARPNGQTIALQPLHQLDVGSIIVRSLISVLPREVKSVRSTATHFVVNDVEQLSQLLKLLQRCHLV